MGEQIRSIDLLDCLKTGELRRRYVRGSITMDAEEHIAVCRYAVCLQALEEPPLAARGQGDWEFYRFLKVPTFKPAISVRVGRVDSTFLLAVRALDGQAGFDLGHLQLKAEAALAEVDWIGVKRELDAAGFWGLASRIPRFGMDGSTWYLEGADPKRQKIVHRWSPEAVGADGPFRAACAHLLQLAELNVAEELPL